MRVSNYYQFPKELLRVPINPAAMLTYMLIYDRLRLSDSFGYVQDGAPYCVYPVKELADVLCQSDRSIKRSLMLLRREGLLKIARTAGGVNRFFTGERQLWDPETEPEPGTESAHTGENSGPIDRTDPACDTPEPEPPGEKTVPNEGKKASPQRGQQRPHNNKKRNKAREEGPGLWAGALSSGSGAILVRDEVNGGYAWIRQ